jgi:cold shock CspA family protein
MKGEVKSYSIKNGYGFITKDMKDYRFRTKDWGMTLGPVPGMRVEFDPVLTDKGLRAKNIRREK